MVGRQLRNLLKDITMGDLTSTQINEVGKNVYADFLAKNDLEGLQDIVGAFRSVTVPSYGQYVPQSGVIKSNSVTGDDELTISAPEGNEVWCIANMDVANNGLSSINVTVLLRSGSDNVVVANTLAVAGGANVKLDFEPVYLGKDIQLVVQHSADCRIDYYRYNISL